MIFVDSAAIKATVRNPFNGRVHISTWYHLFSDQLDASELHEFAASIGCRREWFQPGKVLGRPTEHNPAHDHYDLVLSYRRKAVRAGAVSVDRDQAVVLWRAKRDRWLASR